MWRVTPTYPQGGRRRGDTLQSKDSRLLLGQMLGVGFGGLTLLGGQGLGLPHLVPSSGLGV